MAIKNVTVAGGGVLGAQIAYAIAFHGFDVTLWGRSEGSIERMKPRLAKINQIYAQELELAPAYIGVENPNYPRSFFNDKSEITEERIEELKKVNENAYKGLKFLTNLEEAVKDADLVIETIAEIPDEKTEFYKKLAPYLKEDAILVTNSSTLLPSSFKEFTGREGKYLSLHFANDIHRQNIAEIMRHDTTSDEATEIVTQFAKDIGMYPAVLNKEQPGYILNSLLGPFLGAGLRLYGAEVADYDDIDMDWKISTGSPMGPFEIIDMVGLTTIINVVKMSPGALDPETDIGKALVKLEEKAAKGLLGRETGEGFYKYK